MESGVYVSMKLDDQSCEKIISLCNRYNIQHLPVESLHVTVIYSVTDVEDYAQFTMGSDMEPITCTVLDVDVFGEKDILVLKLHSSQLHERHKQWVELYGAQHSYPNFTPHISLTYNYDNCLDLDAFDHQLESITLISEHSEPLQP